MSTIDKRTTERDMALAAREAELNSGWLTFAGLTIEFIGLWNAIQGFIALFRSAFFTGTPVFGTIAFWGVVWIALGVLQMFAGFGIMAGRGWARWFGIAMCLISAIASMLALGTYPFWGLFVVAIDIVILYALTAHWPGSQPAYD